MNKNYLPLLALGAVVLSSTVNGQSTTSQQQSDKRVWISIGSDAVDLINEKYHSQFSLNQINLHNSSNGSVATLSIPSSQIDSLSELMHHEFNRCAGFVFHESYNEAQSFAQTPSQLTPSVAVNYTIDNPNGVSALVDELNSSNLSSTVNSLGNYNNRYYTQQSGVDAANWIKNKWSTISSSRSDISVETFNHSWAQPSVIATITGTTNPDEIVIIGGHLDSINGSSPSSGRAPGKDDNASGIAIATETLRAIVASGYKPAKTVKLMGYAAEEVGLRGSKAIAQSYKSSGKNVIGVVQFDMSGYKGSSKDIVFMTDYTNNSQNQFMAQLLDTYHPGISYAYDQCGYGCSDHASWHNQGYAASMPFESYMNDINPSIHTSNDTSYSASHAFNFLKLSVTYLAELAKGGTGTTPPPPPPPGDNVLENGVAKTGLSASTGQDIVFTMQVPAGATDIQFVTSGGSGDADMYVKYGSAPTDSSYDCRPYKNGNSETCTGTQTGGTYHVRLKAYSAFSGVSLTGSYTDDGTPPPPPPGGDPIDETVSNISVSSGQWKYYTVELDGDYSDLNVSISGGTGDADLYVRRGSQPTTSSYDCRPYKWGNAEDCSFNTPQSGTWHIGIRGYNASSGITLKYTATPAN